MLAVKILTPKLILHKRSLRLMGNPFEISIVSSNPNWAEDRIDDAVAEIIRVEKLLSTFSDDSSINEINRNAGIKPVKTNSEIFRLISRSLQISELTDGAFDISYNAPIIELNGADNTFVKVAAKTLVNYQSIVLDAKAQTVFLREPEMRIGFGANSMGYAADRAKLILQMHGVNSGVVNAGGDLLTWGLQPDNRPWTIETADLSQKLKLFANIDISNMAVATSVNTEHFSPFINKNYLNDINAKSGFPVSGINSVTIISPSAELADAMATPVIMMGINAGLYLINQLNQLACIIIDDHERVYTSKDINLNN